MDAVIIAAGFFTVIGVAFVYMLYLPALKKESGYPGPENRLYPSIEELCIATVREAYTNGEIDEVELEARMGAAIRGDYRNAGINHLPIQLETVWM